MRMIAHLSDIHFGRTDPAIVQAVVTDVAARKPSLIVMSGDFTQRARTGQYRAARAFMDRLPQPQLFVPGNHDIPLFNLLTRFFMPLRNYKRFITTDLQPVYRDEEMIVIGLNTARPLTWSPKGFWKDGRISESQLAQIKERACNLPAEMFKIVVTHHPFIPPPHARHHGIVHGAARALDQMEQCHVDLCLAGHLHMGYSADVRTHHEAVKRSILSIQAGTATSTRRRGEPNAYNFITLVRDRVIVQVRAWDGSGFVDAARTSFVRADGAWEKVA